MDIKESDKLRTDTERVRHEWIINITHDLKTPLSPIKGYRLQFHATTSI